MAYSSIQHQQQHLSQTPPPLASRPPLPPAATKTELASAKERLNLAAKGGAFKKQRQCSCISSKCLKMYCECFSSGLLCDGCSCINCSNNGENETARKEAIEVALQRNPSAFRPKVYGSPLVTWDNKVEAGQHPPFDRITRVCFCKRTGCLKKYCQCFQANISCSESCKCVDCKNHEGSEKRQTLLHGQSGNTVVHAEKAAKVSSPIHKKRKNYDHFGRTLEDLSRQRCPQFPQANHPKTFISDYSYGSDPVASFAKPAQLQSSTLAFRPLLSDIIQPNDVKELCKFLVVLCGKVAKMFPEKKDPALNVVEECTETLLALTTDEAFNSQEDSCFQNLRENNRLKETNKERIVAEENNVPCEDVNKCERPTSPATQALLCNEHEFMFATSDPQSSGASLSFQLNQNMPEVHVEQEKHILMQFLGCLQNLVNHGRMKEEMYASIASNRERLKQLASMNDITRPQVSSVAKIPLL